METGNAQRQKPFQRVDHRRLHFGPGRQRDKPFDDVLPFADDPARFAIGIVFDQSAFGIGRGAINPGEFQRQRTGHRRMRPGTHQQDRVFGRRRIQIGAGQIAFFGQRSLLPAIAGDPFAGPEFSRFFAQHHLDFGNRMRDQRIDIARPDRDRMEMHIDKSGQQRAAMQIDHFVCAIAIKQAFGAGRNNPPTAHGHCRLYRKRRIDRQHFAVVEDQVDRFLCLRRHRQHACAQQERACAQQERACAQQERACAHKRRACAHR